MNLADKYRPRSFAALIGQEKAVRKMLLAAGPEFTGKAWWISGKKGTGKSTLAGLAAATVADEFYTHTSTGRSLSMSRLREWVDYAAYCAPRAFIVNEAHGLCAPVIEELLDVLDTGMIPKHVAWFFTTTKIGQKALFEGKIDAGSLLSRCQLVAMNGRANAAKTGEYLRNIAIAEGLDGRPVSQYERLVNKNHGDIRACFAYIQSGGMLPGDDDDEPTESPQPLI